MKALNNQLKIVTVIFTLGFMFGCGENSDLDEAEAEGYLQRGWLEYGKGNYSAALLNFERAILKDDSLSDAHNGLGWSHLSASQSSSFNPQLVQKALASFQEAIRLDDKNADAWVGLANSLFLRRKEQNDFRTAIKAIDNASEANLALLYRHDYNSEADLHALKATCLYYLGDANSASIEVKSALAIDSENKTALALANLLNR